jgi:hypothetical protein
MKTCPTCQRSYTDDSLAFCTEDGTALVAKPTEEYDPAKTLTAFAPRTGVNQIPPAQAIRPDSPPDYKGNPPPASPNWLNQYGAQPRWGLLPARGSMNLKVWLGVLALLLVTAVIVIIVVATHNPSSTTTSNPPNANVTPSGTPSASPSPKPTSSGPRMVTIHGNKLYYEGFATELEATKLGNELVTEELFKDNANVTVKLIEDNPISSTTSPRIQLVMKSESEAAIRNGEDARDTIDLANKLKKNVFDGRAVKIQLVNTSYTELNEYSSQTLLPSDTYQRFYDAAQRYDSQTMESLTSTKSLNSFRDNANAKNQSLDDYFSTVLVAWAKEHTRESRNEKIMGDTATLEIKYADKDRWATFDFVREADIFKIGKK